MNTTLLFSVCVILAIVIKCDSAKILAVLPFFAKSHQYVMQPVINELAARGHEVHFYSPIPLQKNYTNLKMIQTNNLGKLTNMDFSFNEIRKFGEIPYVNLIAFWFMGIGTVDTCLQHPEVQKLIQSNEKYDLVILETHFGQEALLAFGHKFKAPVISLASFGSFLFIDEFFGNPFATSYVPVFELPYTNKMTFFQRVHNTIRTVSTILVGRYYYLPFQESLMRQYFNYPGSEKIPPIIDMLPEVALVLTNSQIAVDYSRPWVPNMIGVAGMHIAPARKPLPKEMKDFMDNSKNGVILVSFGSIVPAEKMPDDMRNSIMKAFSKVKQNILWKLPVDSLPGLPKNVKLSKWVPQQDILAHPNCKAFITHGGLLSQEEAVYFAVPFIGVPFFGDQYMNIERAAAAGFGVALDNYNITEESLTWAIDEILNNPSYRETIKKQSQIFRDNPQSPIETAMYWVEYVIRHKGAPHLRSEARKLPWFKYFLLDVIAFLLLVSFVVLYSIFYVVKCALSLYRGKTKPQVKQNKKRN